MKDKSMVMRIGVCLLVVGLCFAISSYAGRRPPYETVHDMDPALLPPVITPEDDPAKAGCELLVLGRVGLDAGLGNHSIRADDPGGDDLAGQAWIMLKLALEAVADLVEVSPH